jgi:hypothetical protein
MGMGLQSPFATILGLSFSLAQTPLIRASFSAQFSIGIGCRTRLDALSGSLSTSGGDKKNAPSFSWRRFKSKDD